MMPQISVVIRTFNSAAYIQEALTSVFSQTISPSMYEILVFDNGSRDGTLKILKQYETKGKVRLFKNETVGPVTLLNIALEKARGQYYLILDSDDILVKNALEKLYEIINSSKNIGFVYADYFEFEEGNITKAKVVSIKNNLYNTLAAGVIFSRKLVVELGGYDDSLFFPEYDLVYKISKESKGTYIQEPLYYYRRHEQSLTAVKERVEKGKEQLFKKLGVRLPIREY